jgi:hypothetical protein
MERLGDSEKRTDDLVDRLILDIKALVLLHGSEADLKDKLTNELVGSHDESIVKFVKALQRGERQKSGGLILMAAGELVLASLLVLAATIILVPVFVGLNSPGAFLQYLLQDTYSGLGGTPLGQYVSLIEFALGAVLMVSAFYSLRQAAFNLKESGIAIVHGE